MEHDMSAMRYDFLLGVAEGIGNGRLHQAEISARIVDTDVNKIAAVIGGILDVLLARFEDFPIGLGLVGGDTADLCGGVASGKEGNVSLAARPTGEHIEFFVFLFVNQRIGAGGDV